MKLILNLYHCECGATYEEYRTFCEKCGKENRIDAKGKLIK